MTALEATRRPVCWILTDGKQGMESQCLGLAEALGYVPTILRIRPRWLWRQLPPQLWVRPLAAPGNGGDAIKPPWPDILIATGRQTVALSIAIKRASGGSTFTIQIQNPTLAPRRFDLVIVPRHDEIDGENVVVTDGALHRISRDKLRDAAEHFGPAFADLPRPRIAVLLGGSNRQFRMTPASVAVLGERLRRVAIEHGAGLLITPSRRTGAENVRLLRDRLTDLPHYLWNMAGENPYFAMLALADAIVVTGDSVNMVSEACTTAKPVYVFDLEGGSRKFVRFHDSLRARGFTRPFRGTLETWSYEPLDETARVAAEVARRFAAIRAQRSKSAQAN